VHNKNGTRRVADHALGGAAERRMLRTGLAVGGDDDQAHFQFIGRFHNFVECDPAADHGVAMAFRGESPPFDRVEMPLTPFYRARIGSQADDRPVPKVRGGGGRLDDVQQHQPRSEFPGERFRVTHRRLR
jgi:hypothetical protein